MSVAVPSARSRTLTMLALVVAGELIFSLPFHVPRYFRASVLTGFDLGNAALGDVFAVYGVTAMLSYFPGGALADRLPPRRLLCLSLLATALGGLYLATLPGPRGLALLYGYWGVTTILLFWAAMIRATREWGGAQAQGRAFGLLDGGRGLAAAVFASAAVAVFAHLAGGLDAALDPQARRAGLRAVALFYTGATAAAALLVWRWLPADAAATDGPSRPRMIGVGQVLRLPAVWWQALVVVAAYCGFKGLDNYALYAHEVLGLDETRAAGFGALNAYLRPLAAVAAGFAADRLGVARSVVGLFALLVLVYAALAVMTGTHVVPWLVYANLAISSAAVFALRGVYFALLEEARIPSHATGTAVGVVSLVGFTPDIFFAAIAGRLLDAAPGAAGHRHYFVLLAGIAIIGAVAAAILTRHAARRRQQAGET